MPHLPENLQVEATIELPSEPARRDLASLYAELERLLGEGGYVLTHLQVPSLPGYPAPEVPGPAEQIEHPAHYGGDTTYEVIKVLEAWAVEDPLIWNTIKYLARAGKKPGVDLLTDLKKAQFYLNRRIANLDEAEDA